MLKSVPNVVRIACTSTTRRRSSRLAMPAAFKSRLRIRSKPVGTLKTGESAESRDGIRWPFDVPVRRRLRREAEAAQCEREERDAEVADDETCLHRIRSSTRFLE